MSNKKSLLPLNIGWKEWVCLPDLSVPAIKAKIDTGARTSALHVFNMCVFKKNKKDMVEFHTCPLQKNKDYKVNCIIPVLDKRIVKDSSGNKEERYVIETDIELNDHRWPIEITLTNRDSMNYRMLLGRTAFREKNIIIHPSKSHLTGRSLIKSLGRKK